MWKITSESEKKGRMIVNIRKLNIIIQSDVYPLPLQSDIIQLIVSCPYIIVVNAAFFFYQWRVHSDDRHKLIVINHREQKSFKMTIMEYKNLSAYVQRQIDRVLRKHRKYSRAYVDDIIIFSKTLEKHLRHLIEIFDTLNVNNIFIKSIKTFIEYFTVNLLDQKMNSFGFATAEDKLKIIFLLKFSRTLQQLKTYLKLINYLREYVSFYADIFKSLQTQKTKLLRKRSIVENVRKVYSNRTKIQNSIDREIASFQTLQNLLSKPFYLIHVNMKRSLFIDLDVSKKFDFDVIVYHVKKKWLRKAFADEKHDYFSRIAMKLILFLSRLLNSIEIRY